VLILALDTCDARGSLAVLRDDSVLATIAHEAAGDYSSWLLSATDRVCAAAEVELGDIGVFAVAAGPGSFTALRVGLTSVKAWGEVYGRPVAAVSRLEALAESSSSVSMRVAAFVDARRAQIYAGLYRRSEAGLLLVGDEEVVSPKAFLERVDREADGAPVAWVSLDPAALTNEPAWEERATRGESVLLSEAMIAPAIGRIALRRAREGKLADSLTLDANYVRRSDAEIFWKGNVTHGK
jgi:tRNA threonylcarbamoyladenosine biosynthesis protein TsaB